MKRERVSATGRGVVVNVYLSRAEKEALDAECRGSGETRSAIVRAALRRVFPALREAHP